MKLFACLGLALALAYVSGCGAGSDPVLEGGGGAAAAQGGSSSTSNPGTGGNPTGFGGAGFGGGSTCGAKCSTDLHSVVDCNGNVTDTCTGDEGCDLATATCTNACSAAISNKQSVGCEYYATEMDQFNSSVCFAVFVANTWNTPVHINVDYAGQPLDVASFARVPSGFGPSLTYSSFDVNAGLPPGEVAILFLAGPQGNAGPGQAYCPIATPFPAGAMIYGGSGIGSSFRITTDVPVVSYQINPYGGGSAAVTGASLLLPTSAWDTNYVTMNPTDTSNGRATTNVIAAEDNTTVTMVPTVAVQGGGGLPGSPAQTPFTFTLNKGQQAQFSQSQMLTGSVLQSDKPVGLMGGHSCMNVPAGVSYCDHGEQMIPPIRALGSEYVGVQYRPRVGEQGIWRVLGTVDGTNLTYSSNVGGPTTLNRGQFVEFISGTPFVVKSQDSDHPFMLFQYMSGSGWQPGMDGYGDADFSISVPPQQYMPSYVFFADPTYPETNLVVVRSKVDGVFKDVNLDCLGPISGWQPVGDYEWARADLITGNFQGVGNCSTGRHEMSSEGPFGLWVWGWGTPQTSIFTENVSYSYPAGMNVQPINTVVIPPTPQ